MSESHPSDAAETPEADEALESVEAAEPDASEWAGADDSAEQIIDNADGDDDEVEAADDAAGGSAEEAALTVVTDEESEAVEVSRDSRSRRCRARATISRRRPWQARRSRCRGRTRSP